MEKYILSEGDIRNLPLEQQYAYNQFLSIIYDKGIVYKAQLDSFDEILQQQYRARVLFNPNSLERYPEILAKNLQNVINTITGIRNDAINGKRSFKEMNFNLINEGLEILKSFIEGKLRSYRGSIGVMELEALLPRIEELKSQILKDMQFYQGYNDEKTAAIVDYRIKKEAYEKLSLFGKLAAKINGKKKELSEAQYKNSYYGMAEIAMVNRQPGDIINPYQYEEYLKQQEQSTGGMKR